MWNDDPPWSRRRDDLLISTDPALLDVAAVHDFLAHHSYWAAGIPLDVLQRALGGSLCNLSTNLDPKPRPADLDALGPRPNPCRTCPFADVPRQHHWAPMKPQRRSRADCR